MAKVISGIQQVGIGVPDEHSAWQWYRQKFGMDIPIFQEAAEAPLMTRYTGNKIQSRSATLAINMQGGGGFEIWQFTSRQTQPPEFNIKLGDLGIYSCRIKSKSVNQTYSRLLNSGADIQSKIKHDPSGAPHFFVKDPYGNLFQVVEGERFFGRGKYETGGQAGCMIGVSDIDKARELYSGILEYDTAIHNLPLLLLSVPIFLSLF